MIHSPSGPVVILVDDDRDYLETAAELIRPSEYATYTAASIKEALDLVHALAGPAVLFTDYNMKPYNGISNGLELMGYVYTNARFPVECVLVTGQKEHALFVQALDLGGRYFVKEATEESEMNLGGLYTAEIKAAYTALKKRIQAMGQKLDPLTGALDRSSAHDRWFQEWNRMARHRTRTACIFMDVNDLKKINDSHGHKAGDLMLTTIASAIKHHIRALDFVYRHGGDEFVAILPETTQADGDHIVQRLTEHLRNTPVQLARGVTEIFSISCGVAVLEAGELSKPGPEAQNSEEKLRALALHDLMGLINQADKLMYAAKKEYKALLWQILWKKLGDAVKRRRA
ncbi:MAG: diguanylate cyclase [Pseudomonadota bacterium]|nr:diguanylate cyclase [Pseudomonadota bacterium]